MGNKEPDVAMMMDIIDSIKTLGKERINLVFIKQVQKQIFEDRKDDLDSYEAYEKSMTSLAEMDLIDITEAEGLYPKSFVKLTEVGFRLAFLNRNSMSKDLQKRFSVPDNTELISINFGDNYSAIGDYNTQGHNNNQNSGFVGKVIKWIVSWF